MSPGQEKLQLEKDQLISFRLFSQNDEGTLYTLEIHSDHMSLFIPDINETNGRSGVVEIENTKIPTPTYIPTKNDLKALSISPNVKREDYKKVQISEYVCWFDNTQLNRLKTDDEYYSLKKSAIQSELNIYGTSRKFIDFKFLKDVSTLDITILEALLDLQNDLNTDVIQIPNFSGKWDYRKAIDKTVEWKKGKKIEKPLMAVASKLHDIDKIKSKIGVIDAVGVNLAQINQLLLIAVKNNFKKASLWVHGISAPLAYPKKSGTMGILINYYGFDSISNRVLNFKASQGMRAESSKKEIEEQQQQVLNNKYFSPVDYNTPKLKELQNNYGDSHNFSVFCNCPVCKNNSIKKILANPDIAGYDNKSHQVLSYVSEGEIYQRKLKNNEAKQYLTSKTYAKKLIKD